VKGWLYADQLRPVAALGGSGNVVSRFVYGAKASVPEYMIRGGVPYRIFSDHFGSPRVIVNSVTGQIVQRMDFHAFGEIIQDSNPGWQPFGFSGGLYDPDTQLVRFGARDFDPAAGRFVSTDPTRFVAGLTNLYEYAAADPLNWTDPDGTRAVIRTKDPYAQFTVALDIFRDAYKKMRDANTVGADKYFHCKANCRAARLGGVGRTMAEAVSFGREWFDTTFKGDSVAECAADMSANAQGRDGDPSVPCESACANLAPPALDQRFR
jgi:RHS repeat-associated protein